MATAGHVGSGQGLWSFDLEGETVSASSLFVRDFAKSVITRAGALTGSDDKGRKVSIDPISGIVFFSTILPVIAGWIKQCKGLKNEEVQGFVASQQRQAKSQLDQEKKLRNKIAKLCEDGKKAELKRAKETGLPADLGRFGYDDETIAKLAHHTIGEFVSMHPVMAEAIVAENMAEA